MEPNWKSQRRRLVDEIAGNAGWRRAASAKRRALVLVEIGDGERCAIEIACLPGARREA